MLGFDFFSEKNNSINYLNPIQRKFSVWTESNYYMIFYGLEFKFILPGIYQYFFFNYDLLRFKFVILQYECLS